MDHKRQAEPEAPTHLIEPLNPFTTPAACRNTPGYIARLLEVYHPRPSTARTSFSKHSRSLQSISTSHARHASNHSQAPISPMDTLADTALSTNPTYDPTYGRPSHAVASPRASSQWSPSRTNGSAILSEHAYDGYGERPAKRARSEALPSPFQQQSNSRPNTSHNQNFGVQHNVEQGINMAEKKRQLSHAERDILDFMESLKSRRHEGSTGPWLQDSQLPVPLAQQLAIHANNTASAPEALQETETVVPDPNVPGSHSSTDLGVTVMRAELEETPLGPVLDDLNGILKDPILRATQTHTPPEEKEAMPMVMNDAPAKSEEPRSKPRSKTSKARSVGQKRSSKANEKHKEGQADAPQQLQSPQSLPTEVSDPRAADLSSSRNGLFASSTTIPPRPQSAQGPRLQEAFSPSPPAANDRSASVPPTTPMMIYAGPSPSGSMQKRPGRPRKLKENTICASCHFSPNSLAGETESWLQCNGCKSWYHFACVGFKNEREVRDVDKFYCKQCTPKFGKTTRKW